MWKFLLDMKKPVRINLTGFKFDLQKITKLSPLVVMLLTLQAVLIQTVW